MFTNSFFLDPKVFWTQNFFGPNLFFQTQKFCWTHKIFGPTFFWNQEPNILFWLKKNFVQNFFDLKFFADPQLGSDPIFFFITKIFLDPKFFQTQDKIQNEIDL